MGKGLIGVGGDLPQDVTGAAPTEESIKNSGSFLKTIFKKGTTEEDEEYYEKYGQYDNVSRESTEEELEMVCPYCGAEMKKGYIQSRDGVWWTKKKHFLPAIAAMEFDKDAVDLNPKEGCVDAYMCSECRKVVIVF